MAAGHLSLLLILVVAGTVSGFIRPTGAKLEILRRWHNFVTDFLTPDQVSRSIDMAALDIHQGKTTEEVIDDIELLLAGRLSTDQTVRIAAVKDGLKAQLGEAEADAVLKRTRHVVAYAITPGVEKVRTNSSTPESVYSTMLGLFTPDYVTAVKHLVKMTLTDQEWNALVSSARPVIELD